MKILVTGAGSLIGHGILRSLRSIHNRDFTVYTADPDHRAVGHWLGDHAVLVPLAKNENYLQELVAHVHRLDIDLVFVGTDPELVKIAEARKSIKAQVVISAPNVIAIGEDKWLTVQFLKAHGFPYPDSALSNDRAEVNRLVERNGFPLFAKPCIGARSVGVSRINNHDELERVLHHRNYILQEFLPEDEGEFTAGTMTFDRKCYSQVIFKRDLKDGNTYRAYHYESDDHTRYVRSVAESLDGVYGPINFQYRIKNGRPVIFEINSRYSGTTPLRTAVGVNEVEMAVDFFKTGKVSAQRVIHPKVAILRTWSDMIVPLEQIEQFKRDGKLDNPRGEYFPFY